MGRDHATPAATLRRLIEGDELLVAPCCFDALSARLVEAAGFPLTILSGFSVSATQLGLPDTGYVHGAEIAELGLRVCGAVGIPVIGDADTGYGNAMNVRHTVQRYAQAGYAGLFVEDQVAPKRCGHTRGKAVVDRREALDRVRAAVDGREDVRARGGDVVVGFRTDAIHTHGLDEALERARAAVELGADWLFVEAPRSAEEMRTICDTVRAPHLANMLVGGRSPILPCAELAELGYRIVAYPIELLSAATRAMQEALAAMSDGRAPENLLSFEELRRVVGFEDYYELERRYAGAGKRDAGADPLTRRSR